MSSLLLLDTLDDRRELWHLLHRLAPTARVAFLARCCRRTHQPGRSSLHPDPTTFPGLVREAIRCDRGDVVLTNTIYADIQGLASQASLDLQTVCVELEGLVRRGRTLPYPRHLAWIAAAGPSPASRP